MSTINFRLDCLCLMFTALFFAGTVLAAESLLPAWAEAAIGMSEADFVSNNPDFVLVMPERNQEKLGTKKAPHALWGANFILLKDGKVDAVSLGAMDFINARTEAKKVLAELTGRYGEPAKISQVAIDPTIVRDAKGYALEWVNDQQSIILTVGPFPQTTPNFQLQVIFCANRPNWSFVIGESLSPDEQSKAYRQITDFFQ